MARITIEDCIEQVPNRFLLVQMAAIRAKQLKKGARPLLTAEENKAVVMSLREIAAGLVKPGDAEAEPLPATTPLEGSAGEPAVEAAPPADAGAPAEAAASAGDVEPAPGE